MDIWKIRILLCDFGIDLPCLLQLMLGFVAHSQPQASDYVSSQRTLRRWVSVRHPEGDHAKAVQQRFGLFAVYAQSHKNFPCTFKSPQTLEQNSVMITHHASQLRVH